MPRITLCSMDPDILQSGCSPTPRGLRQLQATIQSDPTLSDWEVVQLEVQSADVEVWLEHVLATRADIVGFSAYVWSFPTFTALATRLRKVSPQTRLILGGPCARPIMYELPRYRGLQHEMDVVVSGEGEWLMAPLLKQRAWDPTYLSSLPGVHVPSRHGWLSGATPAGGQPLDRLPSAILSNLVDFDRTVIMERYRGCPMSCTYCQWGDPSTPHRVFGEARLRQELQVLRDHKTPAIQLVDSGLNMNERAFKNFARAEAAVGLLKTATLHSSVYPSHLTDEHLEFLSHCKRPKLVLGVQTFTPAALAQIKRPFRTERFERVWMELDKVADVQPELILGLPGDNPTSFKQSVMRLLDLRYRVRIFHLLVLPDALMSRQTPEDKLRFDPDSFRMTSCLGWSEDGLRETRKWLDDLCERLGGEKGGDIWKIGEDKNAPRTRPVEEFWSDLHKTLAPAVQTATGGAWQLADVGNARPSIRVQLVGNDASLQLDFFAASGAKPGYRTAQGVAVSYRGLDQKPVSREAMKRLDVLLDALFPVIAPYMPEHAELFPVTAPSTC